MAKLYLSISKSSAKKIFLVFILLFASLLSTISCSEGKFNDSGSYNGGSGDCTSNGSCGGMQGGAPYLMLVRAHNSLDFGRIYRMNEIIKIDLVFNVPVKLLNNSTYLYLEARYGNWLEGGISLNYDPINDLDPNDNVLTYSGLFNFSYNYSTLNATNINGQVFEMSSNKLIDVSLPPSYSEYSLWRQSMLAVDSISPTVPTFGSILNSSQSYGPIINFLSGFDFGERAFATIIDQSNPSNTFDEVEITHSNLFVNLTSQNKMMTAGNQYLYDIRIVDMAGNTSYASTASWTAQSNGSLIPTIAIEPSGTIWIDPQFGAINNVPLKIRSNIPLESSKNFTININSGACGNQAILGTDFKMTTGLTFSMSAGTYEYGFNIQNIRNDTFQNQYIKCFTLQFNDGVSTYYSQEINLDYL